MAADPPSTFVASLAPLYRLPEREGWQLLRRHFDLTAGFSFIVVTAPDDWGVALLRTDLHTILPAEAGWQRVRFDPAAPFERLSEQLLDLEVPAGIVLVWIDAEPADVTDANWWEARRTAWKQALARLNRYRNTLQARFSCTLALAIPAGVVDVLREAAPDLWAIRSGVFRIEPPGLNRSQIEPFELEHAPQSDDLADRGDPIETLQEVQKLRGKAGKEPQLIELLIRAASQAQARLQWALAIQCLEEAYTVEQNSGGDPEVRFDLAVKLGNLFLVLSRLDRGLFYAERAREIAERYFGADSPNTAIALNKLGQLLQATNRLEEAEPMMRRAIAISEKSFGPEHHSVAMYLNNLAQLLKATNRLTEAEPLMRRSLAIAEKSSGPDNSNVAISLNNLAMLLVGKKRLGEAEPLMRRALAIAEKSFGPDHPRVAVCLNNLAQLLKATNRLAEAEPLMRRALAIDEKSFGPEHPTVATRLNNLALLLKATNRLAEAEPLMRRSLAIDEKSFGPEHPDVAIRLNNLAQLLKDTNRLAEAEPLMRRALEIRLEFGRRTGHAHPNLHITLANYAGILEAMGQGKEEVQQQLQALKAAHGAA